MAYDLSRCPQTEAEAKDYFFTLIGRKEGTASPDWAFVLTNSNLPHNIYAPGLRADATWPFFGLTQMWGTGSGPRGRIFLPTATPDDLGYFTRQLQVIDDAPGGVQGQDLVWSWRFISGSHYVPVTGADSGTGPTPTPPSGLTEAQVQAMIDDSIEQALGPIYALLGETLKVGDRVGLRAASGQALCAEGGGPSSPNQPFTLTSRDVVGAWESYRLEKGQG